MGILATGTMTLEVEGKESEVIRCPVDINGFEVRDPGGKPLRQAGAYRQQPLHPAGQPCPDPPDVRHPHELGHEVCG